MKPPIVDVNVYLSRWPFRRVPHDETAQLVKKLRENNVVQAWCGSFDALLHRDTAAVNLRLANECGQHGPDLFIPIGVVNPTQPDWQEDLRRCHEVHKMPGIRLHPNYHGYKLSDPLARELLAAAAERGLIVQIALAMEDERTQHPMVRAENVDAAPLVEILPTLPKLRVALLNAFRGMRIEDLLVERIAAAGQVYFDLAMCEGLLGVQRLIDRVGLDRILFGSYFPFYVWESARLKLDESGLAGGQIEAVCRANARRLAGA